MGYWYCPECCEEVPSAGVTFEELHATCGHHVKWVNEDESMTFGEAVELAKQGKKITRDGWNGKNQFVYYQESSEINPADGRNEVLRSLPGPVKIRAHLDLFTAQGDIQIGWIASQSDMLACDWRVVE